MRKKLHTWEFQLKGIGGNMRCKLLQKSSTGKTTECSKHFQHISVEKDIFSELNRCIFQISLKYIKLVIPKILFILVLCYFNFHFKITWPPIKINPSPNNITSTKIKSLTSSSKDLFKIFTLLSLPSWRGEGGSCHVCTKGVFKSQTMEYFRMISK